MKCSATALLLLLAASMAATALPNSILGPVVQADSPLNGQDLTDALLAALQTPATPLPGTWRDEGTIAAASLSHLLARPKLFGQDVVLLRATHRDRRLTALDATFADAGSFFGYFDEPLPANLSRREERAEIQKRVAARQLEFQKLYQESLENLRAELAKRSDSRRARTAKVGRTRTLRAEPEEFRSGPLTLRLLSADQRLVRVVMTRSAETCDDWLDPALAPIAASQRARQLASSVTRSADGSVAIESLQPIPQGYRPYCGLNALAMAARHFGLHLDEDWLAAAGDFQNTGSADGSNMLRLYQAVAAEAGFSLDRSSKFDETLARRALDAGFPVIVWRRFSHQRDALHTRFARTLAHNPAATLPNPADPAERASWPGSDAPLHASVLVGHHDSRREFLFLESWSGKDTPRRMHAEELAATAYLTFVFRP